MAIKKVIKTVFQFRRATTEDWVLNKDIVPAAGEPCYDLDLKTLRIGDGATTYENLPVVGKAEIGDSGELQVEIDNLKSIVETLQTNVVNMESSVSVLQENVGDTNITEMQASVTQLTDNMTNLVTQVETNNDEVAEIKQTLETKADAEAISTVTEELKAYVDEQLQNIDQGNIDGGEI